MDRVIAVPYVVRANVAKSPWASGAVRNPGLLGVRGDPSQLFHQAAVLSGIYRLNSSNLRLLSFEYHFTNNVDHTRHFTRSQGLLVRRLSRPGTKAQARTLNIGSKKKK
jgi:hypothetical protein